MNFTDVQDWMKLSYETRTHYIDLGQPCFERGGKSTHHKGILAQFLGTTLPSGRILLCHSCGNGNCSNPFHLYWGTDYENLVTDKQRFGTASNPWLNTVKKYGYEEACRRQKKPPSMMSKIASGNKGKPKSERHKENIAKGVKKHYSLTSS